MLKQVIGQILWIVLMALVMGWLVRSRRKAPSGQAPGVLRYPRSILIVGWVCLLFFTAAAVLSTTFPTKGNPLIAPLIFLGFSLLGIPVIGEYHRVWIKLEPGGMTYGRWFGAPRTLQWSQVARVRYAEALMEFRIKTNDGAAVGVPILFTGLPEFAETVLREVQESCMDEKTRKALGRTAQGHPPAIWIWQ